MSGDEKTRPVLVRLEPGVYRKLQSKAGPPVAGRGGGVAHYLRLLAYSDLGLDPPELRGERVSNKTKASYLHVIVQNVEGTELGLLVGDDIDIQGGNKDFCGTVLGIEKEAAGIYVTVKRKDGWGANGPGIDRVNAQILKPCSHRPVRQFEIISDYWRSIRLAFQEAGRLPREPDLDQVEQLVPSGDRPGWTHRLSARRVYAVLAQYAFGLLGADPGAARKLGGRLQKLLEASAGARYDAGYVQEVQRQVQDWMTALRLN